MNYRLFPAAAVGSLHVIKGSTYQASPGGYITVGSLEIANQLVSSGWTNVATGGADVTANRPVNPPRGTHFLDTTLGYIISYEGGNWRNPATGAIV